MKLLHIKQIIITLIIYTLQACSNFSNNNAEITTNITATPDITIPFNADSAFHFIEKQVTFGPRVPNTEGHIACGNYLVNQFKKYGAAVTEQKMQLTAYNGNILECRNIIASYNLEIKERILLFAHWDTRPYADCDSNPKNYHSAIDGANDGGSGVGVLLELARLFQQKNPEKGIDIILFDAEDYGTPEFENNDKKDTWCLGSQYWAKNPHLPNYKAQYGILLDMVGGQNATFRKETISMRFAPQIVNKVWSKAIDLGYGNSFLQSNGEPITDDHLYINLIARIPSIDIIDYDPMRKEGFPDTWHTLEDNLANISKETLKIVGQTLVEIIYTK